MIGGVFGKVSGIAPGREFTVTYKKLQMTYSLVPWLFFGRQVTSRQSHQEQNQATQIAIPRCIIFMKHLERNQKPADSSG